MRRYISAAKNRSFRKNFKTEHDLFARFPVLKITGADMQLAVESLRNAYRRYVAEVSSPEMAVSLECSAFLKLVSSRLKPSAVADLGSGFSSYVLNSSASGVVSVDDSAAWLERTKDFLHAQGLSVFQLQDFESFLKEDRKFDLIFMDLNFIEVRMQHTATLLEKLNPGGIIVFDDVHKPEYLRHLAQTLPFGNCYLLENITRDIYGRYSLLYVND
jgi:predicted O-methyltransferase YrrM